MFDRYIKFLDKIVEKFNNKDKIVGFLKSNKWKILIFFFLFDQFVLLQNEKHH